MVTRHVHFIYVVGTISLYLFFFHGQADSGLSLELLAPFNGLVISMN
jgi:hypothetical protein